MTISTYTLTTAMLDAIDADDLVAILKLDLDDYSSDFRADAQYTAQWIGPDKTWDLPTYGLVIGSRIVLWTNTDEASVADIAIADKEDDIAAQVREYAEDIAGGLGELVGCNEYRTATTIRLSGGGLGRETMLVRCNLTEASAPVEVNYCNDPDSEYEGTQYQCTDTHHSDSGLIAIGKRLAAQAVEMTEEEFTCDAVEI